MLVKGIVMQPDKLLLKYPQSSPQKKAPRLFKLAVLLMCVFTEQFLVAVLLFLLRRQETLWMLLWVLACSGVFVIILCLGLQIFFL